MSSAEIRANIPLPSRKMAPFRWYGGKGNLAKWILPLLPEGKVYCEPYAGAASLLFHREPRGVEVLNDLHSEIVNVFRVLQDPSQFAGLSHRLTWTLYSVEEFRRAIAQGESGSEVERAWAFFVRQSQGFSGIAKSEGNWSRVFVGRGGMAETASGWRGRLRLLDWWHDRLSRVQIDNRCALEAIAYWDSEDTVHYVDPPYLLDTRKGGKAYKHEQDDRHHERLVDLLLTVQGQVALSGYDSPLYARLGEAGWERHERETASHAAGRNRGSKLRDKGSALEHVKRTEVLWIKRHEQRKGMLW